MKPGVYYLQCDTIRAGFPPFCASSLSFLQFTKKLKDGDVLQDLDDRNQHREVRVNKYIEFRGKRATFVPSYMTSLIPVTSKCHFV